MNIKCIMLFFVATAVFTIQLAAMKTYEIPKRGGDTREEQNALENVFFDIDEKIVKWFHKKIRDCFLENSENRIEDQREIWKAVKEHPLLVDTKIGGLDVLTMAIDEHNVSLVTFLMNNNVTVRECHIESAFKLFRSARDFINGCDKKLVNARAASGCNDYCNCSACSTVFHVYQSENDESELILRPCNRCQNVRSLMDSFWDASSEVSEEGLKKYVDEQMKVICESWEKTLNDITKIIYFFQDTEVCRKVISFDD